MERDFLGIGVRDLAAEDAGGLRSSPAPWAFSSRIPSMQQFMSPKAAQEGRSRRIARNQFSPCGFQPLPAPLGVVESNLPFSPLLVPQKHWFLDRPAIHQLHPAGYPNAGADPPGASLGHDFGEAWHFPHHRSFPMATSWPLRKFSAPGVNPPTGVNSPGVSSLKLPTMAPPPPPPPPPGGLLPIYPASVPSWKPEERNPSKPSAATSQLTIFYAGAVNVYDEIPVDKAEAIMLFVANELNIKPNVRSAEEEELLAMNLSLSSTAAARTQRHAAATPPCSALSSPMSRTSHTGHQSGSGSSAADDRAGSTAAPPPPPATAAAAHAMHGAIPQARKASLARFLEKRKERVAAVSPYPCPQRPETAHSSSRAPLPWKVGPPEDGGELEI